MSKTDYNLYSPNIGDTIYITDDMISKIKRLKSHRANNSGYTPGGIMLQWRYIDNTDIVNSVEEFTEMLLAMQFICMIGEVTDEFREKHNIEYHHEALLRKLYLDSYEDNSAIDISDLNVGLDIKNTMLISTGFKRPFGNSDVYGDIAREMLTTSIYQNKEHYNPYRVDKLYPSEETMITEKVQVEYFRFLDILEEFIKDFKMPYRYFEGNPKFRSDIENYKPFDWSEYLPWTKHDDPRLVGKHSYLDSWKITKSYLREQKLDHIIDSENL